MGIRKFAIGVDIGVQAESTGIAVVERISPPGWSSTECPLEEADYHVRVLRRCLPWEGYPKIAAAVAELYWAKELAINGTLPELIVDQTAVPGLVSDMILKQARVHAKARRVVLQEARRERYVDGVEYVPKATLIGSIEVLLTTGRLKIAEKLKLREELEKELMNYTKRKTSVSPLTADPWRERLVDDLVLAVALPCWRLQRPPATFEADWM